jgi:hypothetical protein
MYCHHSTVKLPVPTAKSDEPGIEIDCPEAEKSADPGIANEMLAEAEDAADVPAKLVAVTVNE